jgi:ArsR family transcriptional regulator
MRALVVKSRALRVPCADIMKTLADDTRLKIIELLFGRAQHVRDLNASLRIEASLLSHHLRVLKQAGLVESTRSGRFLTYRISPRVRSSRRGPELDFGCCKLRFDRPGKSSRPRLAAGEAH